MKTQTGQPARGEQLNEQLTVPTWMMTRFVYSHKLTNNLGN